jgi:arachidonate 15-lipoxygenase
MTPWLPQHDPDPAERSAVLRREQRRFVFRRASENPFAPAPTFASVGLDAHYGPTWVGPYLPLLARAKASEWVARAKRLILRPESKLEAYRLLGGRGPLGGSPAPMRADGTSDERLGRDAVQGPNPVLLRRAARLDEVADFLSAPSEDRRGLGEDIRRALDAGRLYFTDYGLLASALPSGQARDSRWRERYLPSPRVLFTAPPAGEQLIPMAIRVDGRDEAAPVWTRGGGVGFELAKHYVRVADVNLHIMATHLYRTHFVMFAAAMSMRRALAKAHPLHVLLEPHVRFTIAVHAVVDGLLQSDQKIFAAIYAGALPVTRRIIREAARHYTIDRLPLLTDLAERRVLEAPIAYPYRDDALGFHAVIERFVRRYIRSFYASDAEVAADRELAAFVSDLASEDGGGLSGIERFEATASRAGLERLFSLFLFTAGPQHAAVHFGQPDYHSDVGAYPAASYAPPPARAEEATAGRLERALPPPDQAYKQFSNAHLAAFRYDRFGDYDRYALGSVAAARTAIGEMRRELAALEREIAARNAGRAEPYAYLLPSLVPNSINL